MRSQAGRIPPEVSAVLKHEPERGSGAAQPALLVRLQGKPVRRREEHEPRGESVEFRPTLRPVSGEVRGPRTELCFQGRIRSVHPFRELWTTSRSSWSCTYSVYLIYFNHERIHRWECFTSYSFCKKFFFMCTLLRGACKVCRVRRTVEALVFGSSQGHYH